MFDLQQHHQNKYHRDCHTAHAGYESAIDGWHKENLVMHCKLIVRQSAHITINATTQAATVLAQDFIGIILYSATSIKLTGLLLSHTAVILHQAFDHTTSWCDFSLGISS